MQWTSIPPLTSSLCSCAVYWGHADFAGGSGVNPRFGLSPGKVPANANAAAIGFPATIPSTCRYLTRFRHH